MADFSIIELLGSTVVCFIAALLWTHLREGNWLKMFVIRN
jgi:hypothetical protein